MRVALTGATGFIGSHILTELEDHGHTVIGLVRDHPELVTAAGGTAEIVDLSDRSALVSLLNDADAAVHTASPGDETSANLDTAVVDAAIEAFAGTGKPYIYISGLWTYGSTMAITEDSPPSPPALVAWKEPINQRVLDAPGMRGVVIESSTAYGDGGGGIPGCSSARDARGHRPADGRKDRRADRRLLVSARRQDRGVQLLRRFSIMFAQMGAPPDFPSAVVAPVQTG